MNHPRQDTLHTDRRINIARTSCSVVNGMFALSSPRTQLICPCRRRTLADAEKASYITAVKCMQSLPALHDHGEAVRTRFDEFQSLHIEVADRVHATVSLSSCWLSIAVRESKSIARVNSFLGIDVS